MPWLTDKYPSTAKLESYGLRGIPSLVLMNEDGSPANKKARNDLANLM